MHRSLRIRLSRAWRARARGRWPHAGSRLPGWSWRARARGRWPDVGLAAALSLVAGWLAARPANVLNVGAVDTADTVLSPAVPPPGWAPATDGPSGWVLAGGVALTLLITAPLAVRRRWPLGCLLVQFAALLPFDIHVSPATLLALAIGGYSLAVHGRSVPLSIGVLLAAGLVTTVVKDNTWPDIPDWAGAFAILTPIALFGVAVRAARSRARASHQRADAVAREQRSATRLAVARERARIARELHDVVSHHVSVMTIQAGAAGKVIDADPELARGALSAIEASGRETMDELRHLLGVLAPERTDEPLRPQPGLEALDALVATVRRAGQPVTLRRATLSVPHGVGLTAYRVVQEALTNALRYAPGAATTIIIDAEPSDRSGAGYSYDVVVEVCNDAPPTEVAPDTVGSGSGLLGLAERLRLYGGTLRTGRRIGGGFRVVARIPWDDPSPTEGRAA